MMMNMLHNLWRAMLSAGSGRQARAAIRVKQLAERDRRRMLKHFMAFNDSDRLLRFGTVLPDEQVAAYVNRIDFARDTLTAPTTRYSSWWGGAFALSQLGA
jgi:hypothetical protein